MMFDGSQEFGNVHADLLNEIRNSMIHVLLARKFDVVVDETFVRIRDIEEMYNRYRYMARVVVVPMNVSLNECLENNRSRRHGQQVAPHLDPKPVLDDSVVREYQQILEEEADVVAASSGRWKVLPSAPGTRPSYPISATHRE